MNQARPITRRSFHAMAASAAALVATPQSRAETINPVRPSGLTGVRSWAYQLQKANLAELARSPYDLIVIDATKNGDASQPITRNEIARLKSRRKQPARTVLAYVSIGEAEDYRYYWRSEWLDAATPEPQPPIAAGPGQAAPPKPSLKTSPPAAPVRPDRWLSAKAPPWLEDENEVWGGNFGVKYWDPGWQDIMFAGAKSYLDRVLAQGFDGVYLDRVDAYYGHVAERPTAADDMAELVVRLAAKARAIKPNCLIVPQNGEELLTRPAYVDVIDGIAKEDLLYGSPTEDMPNNPLQIANSDRWLSNAVVAARPVMVIEYLAKPDVRLEARAALTDRGFIPYFGPRKLDRLMLPDPPPKPTPTGVAPPAPPRKTP